MIIIKQELNALNQKTNLVHYKFLGVRMAKDLEVLTCMHCRVQFHAEPQEISLGKDPDSFWAIFRYDCPSCRRIILFLINGKPENGPRGAYFYIKYLEKIEGIEKTVAIHPFGFSRHPCPSEAPLNIANDYKEACLVLPFSAKASAALSRRCLQSLLRQSAKVKPSDLSKEIQEYRQFCSPSR
jgi:hypothetical protein